MYILKTHIYIYVYIVSNSFIYVYRMYEIFRFIYIYIVYIYIYSYDQPVVVDHEPVLNCSLYGLDKKLGKQIDVFVN